MEEYKKYCSELLDTDLGDPLPYKDYLMRRFVMSDDASYLMKLAQTYPKSTRQSHEYSEKTKRHVFSEHGGELDLVCCKHIRCLTLTTDVDDPMSLIEAADKIVKSYMFDVRHYWYALELTKSGLPHIHMLVGSHAKRFDASKIKQFWSKRYECVRPRDRTGDDYYKYLFKEINNISVIEYCQKHGVPQTKTSEASVQKETNEQEEIV